MNRPDPTPPPAELAVIIPAFRRRHLAETLASFAAQTDRRFHLYIADDGSPESLAEVVAPFRASLALTYKRFDDNRGLSGLVGHWHRAIALAREPWIWLFSDDDVAAPDCVAAVRSALAGSPAPRLLRFDVDFIGRHSEFLRSEAEFPPYLSAAGYTHRLLRQHRETCVIQNIVFARSVYDAEGGFTPTMGGYCADYASWPRFARTGGIQRLAGAKVRFRQHDDSVGIQIGFRESHRRDAIAAYREAIRAVRSVVGDAEAGAPRWRSAELAWFGHWFRYLPRPLDAAERALLAATTAELWPDHPLSRRVAFWRNYVHVLLRAAAREGPLARLRSWLRRVVS